MKYTHICIQLITLLVVFNSQWASSQETALWEKLNYIKAVENGTRNRDGKPGVNYWQNHADYDLKVKFDVITGSLSGEALINYYNESPDSISNIVFRIYPNVRKKGAVRNLDVNAEDINEGVTLDSIFIDGVGYQLSDLRTYTKGTNLLVNLPHVLEPKNSIEVECKWVYPYEKHHSFRRTGLYKDDAWFIGYFYPQIAVYDDMENGWDFQLSHLGMQEFYNDFNNYKVSITVPEGFYVWSTGSQTNESDVYGPILQDRLKQARLGDEIVHILTKEDDKSTLLKSNVWKYTANEVPDFAFGIAKNFCWDASTVKLSSKSVFVSAAYNPESPLFGKVAAMAAQSIQFASETSPNVEYPYSKCTVFNGMQGGGMEFPMIANNAESRGDVDEQNLTFHEIFHNYFPFMTGLNEKRYPFMDEGLTAYFSDVYTKSATDKEWYSVMLPNGSVHDIYDFMVASSDFPLIHSYGTINKDNTFFLYYVKPNVAYRTFAEMVGEDAFLEGIHAFVKRWKGKHPTPWDMFYTFNDVLGENYNWYWEAWFFKSGYPDLSLSVNGKDIQVTRKGKDSLPLSVNLLVTFDDGTTMDVKRSAEIWKNGNSTYPIKLDKFNKIKSVEILPRSIPDIDKSNNKLILKN